MAETTHPGTSEPTSEAWPLRPIPQPALMDGQVHRRHLEGQEPPGRVTVEHLSLMGRRAGRAEDGQDTTEYVLVIILLALAFAAGMMVWSRSVNGAYGGAGDCIAATTSTGSDASRGTPRGWETGRG